MVHIIELNQLEYTEALLDSPEFRDKLDKHEKHILQANKEIKILLNKCEDVIQASDCKINTC
jgi:GTPase involved in cell partitioning and DNA repair